MGFIRAFGLLSNDQTPCGQPLPPSDAHALTEITTETGLSQRELAQRLCLDRSSVSRLVDRLVTRGWVRRADGADRRTVRLIATPAGQTVASDIANARSERFAALLDAVPYARRDDVVDAIRLLTAAARTHEELTDSTQATAR